MGCINGFLPCGRRNGGLLIYPPVSPAGGKNGGRAGDFVKKSPDKGGYYRGSAESIPPHSTRHCQKLKIKALKKQNSSQKYAMEIYRGLKNFLLYGGWNLFKKAHEHARMQGDALHIATLSNSTLFCLTPYEEI